jgi:hypothetical protein
VTPVAVLALLVLGTAVGARGADAIAAKAGQLAFTAEGDAFRFDTGSLRGTLRGQGRSLGLGPMADTASGAPLSGAFGLFSHYRLLDADTRYGTAGWDWASTGRLMKDGAVESQWTADAAHPFDMKAVYRWSKPDTYDVTTTVTAQKDLRTFEVFLASYFEGFPASSAYVEKNPQGDGKPGFMEARQSSGVWQTFPRDERTAKVFADGRWKRPPNPVDWVIMPRLAGTLALRRDDKTGMAALLMAPPTDCFAISMPFSGEGHRSVYLSLFGQDIPSGKSATARARLVLGHGITDAQAIQRYREYLAECEKHGKKK